MGFLIAGLITAAIGLALWFSMKKKGGKLGHLANTETSLAKNLKENFLSMTDSFGAGNFSLYTELKGVAIASTPLEGELSKNECVHYKSIVTREYEELQKTNTSNGTKKKWVRKTEVVSTNENTATGFAVKDNTGEILVDISGAKLDMVQTFSKFEKVEEKDNTGTKISIGGFSLTTGGGKATIRTLGYKYVEHSIPINTQLYVLGEANDRSGKLMISKPKDKTASFIVSTKSEDELISKLDANIKGFKIGAFVCFSVGGVLAIFGIIKMIAG